MAKKKLPQLTVEELVARENIVAVCPFCQSELPDMASVDGIDCLPFGEGVVLRVCSECRQKGKTNGGG